MKIKNNIILAIFFSMMISLNISSQNLKKEKEIIPFKIETKYLSGLEIPKVKLKDHPNRDYFQRTLYKGSELSVFILSSETVTNKIDNFPIDEFVYYINGRAEVKNDKQNVNFYANSYLAVPKGFSGTWTNNGGNTYHLELSVISNKRSKKIMPSEEKFPFLLDRNVLSGIGITQKDSIHFKDILYKGSELEISAISEKPITKNLNKNNKEVFIHILVGRVTLTNLRGKSQTFYKGDFFIIPRGFKGTWQSEGQNLLRTVVVSENLML